MSLELVVAPGGCINLKGPARQRRSLKPGDRVRVPEDLSEQKANDLLKSGYLRPANATGPRPANPPGVPDVEAAPSELDVTKFAEGGESPIKSSVKADVAAKAKSLAEEALSRTKERMNKAKKAKKAPVSPWNLNPADLADLDLPTLATMALEKGYVGEAFATVKDAIDFLSQDA